MPEASYILFCRSPLDPGQPDPDFEGEFRAAQQAGWNILLFDYDELTSGGNVDAALRRVRPAEHIISVIYRGWMLTPTQYQLLYTALQSKNYLLMNTPDEYRRTHYLPDSLPYIREHSPLTVYEPWDGDESMPVILEKANVFGSAPVIIKDYVKSEKHAWETACFVPDASDKNQLERVIHNFLQLRDKYLNEGVVIREFVTLHMLTNHSRSGMPLAEEYRLFFVRGRLLTIDPYWEEGTYPSVAPDIAAFEQIGSMVESHFFSMDIAHTTAGEWIIVELGDGQVSGLPPQADPYVFYRRLKEKHSPLL